MSEYQYYEFVALDVLTVVAGQTQGAMPDRIPISDAIDKLPDADMKALLVRVAEGDGSRVMSELNRLTYSRMEVPTGKTLTCVDLAARAIEVREKRLKKEARAAVAERRRMAIARKRHLDDVMKQADMIWNDLNPLMDQKIASAYDNVATQLKELCDAYKQAKEETKFQCLLVAFREKYSRRQAMMRRIKGL